MVLPAAGLSDHHQHLVVANRLDKLLLQLEYGQGLALILDAASVLGRGREGREQFQHDGGERGEGKALGKQDSGRISTLIVSPGQAQGAIYVAIFLESRGGWVVIFLKIPTDTQWSHSRTVDSAATGSW